MKRKVLKRASIFLTLFLAICLLLAMIPLTASSEAAGECRHEHGSDCSYSEGMPCTHVHDDNCGWDEETGSGCTHANGSNFSHDPDCNQDGSCTCGHDATCGYAPAVPCDHVCDNDCGGLPPDEEIEVNEDAQEDETEEAEDPVVNEDDNATVEDTETEDTVDDREDAAVPDEDDAAPEFDYDVPTAPIYRAPTGPSGAGLTASINGVQGSGTAAAPVEVSNNTKVDYTINAVNGTGDTVSGTIINTNNNVSYTLDLAQMKFSTDLPHSWGIVNGYYSCSFSDAVKNGYFSLDMDLSEVEPAVPGQDISVKISISTSGYPGPNWTQPAGGKGLVADIYLNDVIYKENAIIAQTGLQSSIFKVPFGTGQVSIKFVIKDFTITNNRVFVLRNVETETKVNVHTFANDAVIVEDMLPEGMIFLSGSNSTTNQYAGFETETDPATGRTIVRWTANKMPAGETTYKFSAAVPSTNLYGRFDNSATVAMKTASHTPSNSINVFKTSSTYHAKYYTVIFNSNGGSAVTQQRIAHGNKVAVPLPPSKDGFVFGGWFTDNNTFIAPWNFGTSSVAGNLTLYALWNKPFYCITYETDLDYQFGLADIGNSIYWDTELLRWRAVDGSALPDSLTLTPESIDGGSIKLTNYSTYAVTVTLTYENYASSNLMGTFYSDSGYSVELQGGKITLPPGPGKDPDECSPGEASSIDTRTVRLKLTGSTGVIPMDSLRAGKVTISIACE